MFFRFLSVLSLSLLLTASALRADVSCAKIFGDHMVLQREKPLRIWGTADAGERILVEFAGQRERCTTDRDGNWSVTFKALKASSTPRVLSVTGKNKLSFSDVLVGEVWICSGQSNMEKPIGERPNQKPTDRYKEELDKATHPLVRLYQVPRSGKLVPPKPGYVWLECNADNLNAMWFSAVGYFFACELNRVLQVPVGIIHSSYSGTRIEPWISPEGYAPYPQLRPFADSALSGQKYDDVEASSLYKTMIKPLAPLSICGFLWYQGESNCINADGPAYTLKMRALIEGWRNAFQDKRLPFYYVHLAPYAYSKRKGPKALSPEALPLLWEAQVKALEIPYTALVPTLDITADVNDIHPTNKKEVGLRLARLALSESYALPDIDWACPIFRKSRVKGGKIIASFSNAKGLKTRDGKAPSHFFIAGKDRCFVPATAVIQRTSVIVSSSDVPEPVALRFAWDESAMPNLMNDAGLPALPFRTDNWPIESLRKQPASRSDLSN
jgi:sialate O-acetylesterase